MIVSKRALAGAALVAKVEKAASVAGAVCIEPDGTVVAVNRYVLYVVEPPSKELIKRVPLTPAPGAAVAMRVVLPVATVETILKSISKDVTFKGLLEFIDITPKRDTLEVVCTFTDGKKMHSITVNRSGVMWLDWRVVFGQFNTGGEVTGCFVWNRKRLLSAIEAMETACQYDGEFSPVFVRAGAGRTILRCINEMTEQRIVCVLSESETQWLEENTWEKCLVKQRIKLSFVNSH